MHSDRNAYKNYTPRAGNIVFFMTLVTISGIIVGYGLAYTNNAIPVLNAIFGWDTEQEIALNDALISTAFSLGAAVGASTGGYFIGKGRRLTMFIAIFVGIFGCAVQCL